MTRAACRVGDFAGGPGRQSGQGRAGTAHGQPRHLVALLVISGVDENLVENLVKTCSSAGGVTGGRHGTCAGWAARHMCTGGRRAPGSGGGRGGGKGGAAGARARRTGHVGDVALVQADVHVVYPELGAVHLSGPDVRVGAEQHVLELREFLVRLLHRLFLGRLLGEGSRRVLLGGEHIVVVIDDGRRRRCALARGLLERLVGLLDERHACGLERLVGGCGG